MKELRDQVAIVTGAANGIGYALASALADAGMRLMLSDIDAVALESAATRLSSRATDLDWMSFDVSSATDWETFAEYTIARFGGADLLCSNAGVTIGGRDIGTLTINDWNWVIGVNLYGAIHGVAVFLPFLRQSAKSHIVFTGSMGGFYGAADNAAYCASKAALMSFAESLSRELRRDGSAIGVTLLCPSAVATSLACSETRRPERFFNPCKSDTDAAAAAGVTRSRANAITADEVARLAVEAILGDWFYVPTHPNALAVIGRRAADTKAERPPS